MLSKLNAWYFQKKNPILRLTCSRESFKQVYKLRYKWYMLTSYGISITEIGRKIAIANYFVLKMSPILTTTVFQWKLNSGF